MQLHDTYQEKVFKNDCLISKRKFSFKKVLRKTPNPKFGFLGLKEGNSWCVCAASYAQAIDAGIACPIYLKKTNQKTLEIIPIEKLKKFAIDLS